MALGDVQVKIGADISGLKEGIERSHRAVSGLGDMMRTAVGTALGFATAIAAINAVGKAFDFAKESIFGLNNRLQQAQIAFATMLGGGEKAKAFLDDLARFAAKTPFEFPDLVTATQRMMAYGFEAKQVIPLLTAVGNAAAALGGGKEAIDRVTTALGQMRAKGKVAAEEMRQLTEAGIPAWDMLAKKLGVDVATAMKMVEKRAVEAHVMIEAFIEEVGERFPNMMEKQSRTFAGAMSTIKDSLQMAIATGFKPFFDIVTAGLVKLADLLSSDAIQGAVKRFAQGWDRFAEDFRMAFANPIAAVEDGLISFGERVGITLRRIADRVGGFARDLRTALANPFAAAEDGVVTFGERVGLVLGRVLSKVGELLKGVAEGVRILATGEFRGGLFGLTEDHPVVQALIRMHDTLVKVGEAAGKALSGFLRPEVLNGILAIINPFGALARELLPAVVDLIGTVAEKLADIATKVAPKLQDLAAAIGNVIKSVAERVTPKAAEVLQSIINAVGSVLEKLTPSAVDLLTSLVDSIGKLAENILPPLLDLLKNFIDNVAPPLTRALSSIVSWLAQHNTVLQAAIGAWVGYRIAVVVTSVPAIVASVRSMVTAVQGSLTALQTQLTISTGGLYLLAMALGALAAAFVFNWGNIRERTAEHWREITMGATIFVAALSSILLPGLGTIFGAAAVIVAAFALGYGANLAGIRSKTLEVLSAIKGFFTQHWQDILAATTALGAGIGAVFGGIGIAFGALVGAFAGLAIMFITNAFGIRDKVAEAFGALKKFLEGNWREVVTIASQILLGVPGGLVALFTTNAWGIRDKVSGAFGQLKGYLGEHWREMLSTASLILTGSLGLVPLFVTNAFGIRDKVTEAFGQLKRWALQRLDQLKEGAARLFEDLLVEVARLPGRILQALGDMGRLLWDAGRALIQGLIGGIKDKLDDLRNFLGDVKNKIISWKGPITDDRQLLVPAGQAIMGGLIVGLNSEMPEVRETMQAISFTVTSLASETRDAVNRMAFDIADALHHVRANAMYTEQALKSIMSRIRQTVVDSAKELVSALTEGGPQMSALADAVAEATSRIIEVVNRSTFAIADALSHLRPHLWIMVRAFQSFAADIGEAMESFVKVINRSVFSAANALSELRPHLWLTTRTFRAMASDISEAMGELVGAVNKSVFSIANALSELRRNVQMTAQTLKTAGITTSFAGSGGSFQLAPATAAAGPSYVFNVTINAGTYEAGRQAGRGFYDELRSRGIIP